MRRQNAQNSFQEKVYVQLFPLRPVGVTEVKQWIWTPISQRLFGASMVLNVRVPYILLLYWLPMHKKACRHFQSTVMMYRI